MNVRALARGGFSAYGDCSYDARSRAVIVQAAATETVTLRAVFTTDINTIDYELANLELVDEPAITDDYFTVDLTNFDSGSTARFDVMLDSGEQRQLNIAIVGAPPAAPFNPGGDYGDFEA
jgi:hypothetical protein